MIVRTITLFLPLGDSKSHTRDLERGLETLERVYESVKNDFPVQTLRVATDPFENWAELDNLADVVAPLVEMFNKFRLGDGTDITDIAKFLNIGPATSLEAAEKLGDLLVRFPTLTATVLASGKEDGMVVDERMCGVAARTMVHLSRETEGGGGNFNFGALFGCRAGIPFFPAGYGDADGGVCIGVGLQSADVFVESVESVLGEEGKGGCMVSRDEIDRCMEVYQAKLVESCERVEKLVIESKGEDVGWQGIDLSLAPAPSAKSIAKAFEIMLGGKPFGSLGTLQLASAVTSVLQKPQTTFKTTGYCGLMLPPLEDVGLASSASNYTIRDLVTFSAVCGIGLDAVPVPGDATVETLTDLMREIAALSVRLNHKQLSARLFPVPGKSANETVHFDNPHLCDCPTFDLK